MTLIIFYHIPLAKLNYSNVEKIEHITDFHDNGKNLSIEIDKRITERIFRSKENISHYQMV